MYMSCIAALVTFPDVHHKTYTQQQHFYCECSSVWSDAPAGIFTALASRTNWAFLLECRAWSCTEGSAGDGQQCLIKHQLVDPCQAPPGQGEPLLTFCDSCVIAEAEETASTRVDAINDSVDALVKFQGKLGMPDVQYAYADGHHFTVYQ